MLKKQHNCFNTDNNNTFYLIVTLKTGELAAENLALSLQECFVCVCVCVCVCGCIHGSWANSTGTFIFHSNVSLISESETHILYRCIDEIFQVFISWNFDDYGLQIMKTPNSVVLPPFAWITASMWRGVELISLWHCSGVMKPRLLW